MSSATITRWSVVAAAVLVLSLLVPLSTSRVDIADAGPGDVLMLESTLFGGAGSTLAQKFVLAGKNPVIVNDATWSAMSAADFDDYDAIVLGDPRCRPLPSPDVAAANAAVWSSVVDGNVLIFGSDETFHESQGGDLFMEKAAAFTVAQAGRTGAYISLSCYYHGTAAGTPVPMLSGFGSFTATGVGCYNDAHIVATHPALTGVTDATLSNWGCSVHEAFDSWPIDFEVLAIARGIGTVYTATDGSIGTPYVLARGVQVISDVTLTPDDDLHSVGETHTVTAEVVTDDPSPDTPVVGTEVTFRVIAGPHVGTAGTAFTDSSGMASFSYPGASLGEDTIEAEFVDSLGRTQRSNRVTVTWVPEEICGNGIDDDLDGEIDEGCNEAPVCDAAVAEPNELWPPNHKMHEVGVSGVSDADGDDVTVTIDSIFQDESLDLGPKKGEADGDGVGTSTAMLRAQRLGGEDGRVYHVGFTASDGTDTCTGSVQVSVPHDQAHPAVDGGPLHDSTGS